MRLVHVNVDLIEAFVITSNAGIVINADVDTNNCLIKADVIMVSFGILVYVNVNMINHVMLENILIVKIVNVEKS